MGNLLTRYRQDSIWDRRGITASCLAPLFPALLFATLAKGPFPFLAVMGIVIAYLQMLLCGLPLLSLLNWRRKVSPINVALVTIIAGALPWMVLLDSSIILDHLQHGQSLMQADESTFWIAPLVFGSYGLSAGFAWWVLASPLAPASPPIRAS